jgi:hypothetical protein
MKTNPNQSLMVPVQSKSKSRIIQDAYHEYLMDLDTDEFTLFHLTTTYLPYQNITYSPKVINQFFINFYLKNLLPDLLHTRTWSRSKKILQPIVLTFLDDHNIDPLPVSNKSNEQPIYASPVRLHHHSIVASRLATTDQFMSMLGDNTFVRYSGKMMTSNLNRCDAGVVYYVSKMLWKYPEEVLQFGFKTL